MCRNALDGKLANSHLDDLESFYWVLCFIVCVDYDPGLSSARQAVSPEMTLFVVENCKAASLAKHHHFSRPFGLPLASFWGQSVVRLMRNLHLFFHKRTVAQDAAMDLGQDPPPHDPGADYKEISSYFDLAIKELGRPDPGSDSVCCN